jgi:hypothetical protein
MTRREWRRRRDAGQVIPNGLMMLGSSTDQ